MKFVPAARRENIRERHAQVVNEKNLRQMETEARAIRRAEVSQWQTMAELRGVSVE